MARSETPGWQVGLLLSLPLFDFERKANLHAATAEMIQAEALASAADRGLPLEWKNSCQNVKRWEEARVDLEEAYRSQLTRADLEEKRFQLARVATLNVIQAGDELAQAAADLRQAEVELRLAAWKVRRIHGDIPAFLKSIKEAE